MHKVELWDWTLLRHRWKDGVAKMCCNLLVKIQYRLHNKKRINAFVDRIMILYLELGHMRSLLRCHVVLQAIVCIGTLVEYT